MGYHHVALATRDLDATHRFYTEAMGFTLVKAVGRADRRARRLGQARLLRHRRQRPDRRSGTCTTSASPTFDPRISEGLGLPIWVNHIAFDAPTSRTSRRRREHWLDLGIDVVEVDHGFCVSIYATDPNGIAGRVVHRHPAPHRGGPPGRALATWPTRRPELEAPPDAAYSTGAADPR